MNSEDRVIIRDESYPAVLLEALALEKPGLASDSFDAVLCVGRELQIPVHKLVFASVSDFMGQLLKEHEVGCQEDTIGPRIILEDMKFDVLKLVVEFAYTGEASIPAPLADDIFEAAQRLGIKFLRDSFLRLDHEDYEDIRAGRKTLDLQGSSSKETVNLDQSTSDTESAESFDVGDNLRAVRSPGQVYSSKNKKNNSENVLFTITKHQEQEETSQQPDNDQSASYLVRFENEEPVSQGPQVTHHPLVVGKTKLPGSMQLLMPAKSSAVQQQPRLEAGQIMTIRRPDGTLVQVVAQRSRQQQQQILAPRHPGQVFHPRKMFLPKGVQIQPKAAPVRDALAIAMASITDNSPQQDPKPIRTSDLQVVSMSPQPLVVATTRQQPQAIVLNRKAQPAVIGRPAQVVGNVRLPHAVVVGRPPQAVIASARQSQVIVRQQPKTVTAIRQQQPHLINRKPQVFATTASVSPIRQPPTTQQLPSITSDPTDSDIAITSTPSMFASPSKLSAASLTVSEPKPTFPSTVPDDFLEDSSFSEAASSDVSPSPVPTRLQDEDLASTRRSGRERKLNRKYLDDGTEELESSLQFTKNVLKKSSTTPRSATTTTSSNKRKSEDTSSGAPAKKLPKVHREEESEEHSSEEKSEKENKKVQSEKSKKSEKKNNDVQTEQPSAKRDPSSAKKMRLEETKEKKTLPEKTTNQRISVRRKKPDEILSESKAKKVERRIQSDSTTPDVKQSSRVTRRSDATAGQKMTSRSGPTNNKSPEKRSMRIKKK